MLFVCLISASGAENCFWWGVGDDRRWLVGCGQSYALDRIAGFERLRDLWLCVTHCVVPLFC